MGHEIAIDLDLTGQLRENIEFARAGNQYLETQPLEGAGFEPDEQLFAVLIMSIIAFDMRTAVYMLIATRFGIRSTSASPGSEQRKGKSDAQPRTKK